MPPRPPMPEGVKRAGLIRAMGYGLRCAETGDDISPEDAIAGRIHFDHNPPLALREYDEATGKYKPDANDILFIDVVSVKGHAIRTHKRRGLNRGDLTQIAHGRRLRKKTELHHARMAAKGGIEAKPERQKQKIKSRGFQTNRNGDFKQKMGGRTERR